MDARMLVVTDDRGLAEMLRPQVENQGCLCQVADCWTEASRQLLWADAVLLDLELGDGGVDVLRRIRDEAPEVPVVGVATNEADATAATDLGATRVLLEPISITDVVDAVRAVGQSGDGRVIDLRGPTDGPLATTVPDDRPWWATR